MSIFSKKTEFVKAAMQGMISNPYLAENWTNQELNDEEVAQEVANFSIQIANEVINQLNVAGQSTMRGKE